MLSFSNFLFFLVLLSWVFFSTKGWGRGEREGNPPEASGKEESVFNIPHQVEIRLTEPLLTAGSAFFPQSPLKISGMWGQAIKQKVWKNTPRMSQSIAAFPSSSKTSGKTWTSLRVQRMMPTTGSPALGKSLPTATPWTRNRNSNSILCLIKWLITDKDALVFPCGWG